MSYPHEIDYKNEAQISHIVQVLLLESNHQTVSPLPV